VGGQQVDRHLQLGRVTAALQQPQIVAVTGQPVVRQALGQTPAHQRLFAVRHADAGGVVNKALELGELAVGQGC